MKLEVRCVPVLTLWLGLSIVGLDVQAATFTGGSIASKCLDMAEGENGTRVQFWSCHDGENQSWTLVNGAVKALNGKCLDWHVGDGERNGARVQVWTCHYGENQQWTLKNGEVRSKGGFCLSAPIRRDNSLITDNGTALILWKCDGGKGQKWIVQ